MAQARVSNPNPSHLALFFILLVQICRATVISEKDGNSDRYVVVFDASTMETMAHVFRFDENSNLLKINGELTAQFKGKSFGKQEGVASVLDPLLQEAINVVPEKLRSVTPLILGVTDELLLVGEENLKEILHGVGDVFSKTPLLYDSEWIKVLPGAQQGVYLWATLNYLLGNMRGDYSKTVSLFDQERSSVETTYAVSKEVSKEAKSNVAENNYISNYYFNGSEYSLYSYSYLGYGAYAARAEILKYTNDSYTYCVVNDYNDQYEYYGEVYNVRSAPSGSNFEKCKANVLKALNLNATCDVNNCTFNGVWNGGGGAGVQNLYLSNGFHHTAADVGVGNHTGSSSVRPLDYEKVAKEACEPKSFEEMRKLYPDVFFEEDIPYICMDLVYLSCLFIDGLAIEPTKVVTTVNDVKYGDSYLEVFWPFGAALEIITSDRTRKPSILNIPSSISDPSFKIV